MFIATKLCLNTLIFKKLKRKKNMTTLRRSQRSLSSQKKIAHILRVSPCISAKLFV